MSNSASQSESYQNSSFQNYTSSSNLSLEPSRKRRRGISAVLQDHTNVPLETRRSKVKATTSIQEIVRPLAPRGNPSAAVAAKQSSDTIEPPPVSPMEGEKTLYSMFHKSRSSFDTGAGMLLSYIQRNAVAISIMATAMTDHSITEAAQNCIRLYTVLISSCTQVGNVVFHRTSGNVSGVS